MFMRFDQYQSEEQALKEIVVESLRGHEDKLMNIFIMLGPDALRQQLRIKNDFVWSVVFDHLVFSKEVLRRCVLQFLPFFKNLVMTKGPFAVRAVLGIEDKMYDPVFETLFDFVAVSHGALFEYVYDNTQQFMDMIREGQGQQIRSMLCLDQPKYDYLWSDVLDFLIDSFSRRVAAKQMVEHQLQLINLLRFPL